MRFENLFLDLFSGESGRPRALLGVCMGVEAKGNSGLDWLTMRTGEEAAQGMGCDQDAK